ncbi:MAG: hypothetical protein ABSA58_06495, partial [Acetobacteraceae bacterium]
VAAGGSLTVNNALEIGNGGKLTMAGGTATGGAVADCIYVQTGGTLTGFGTLDTRAGAAVDDDGTIVATGGTLTVNGNIGGEGSLQIAANSTAMLTGTSYGVAGISFVGADATLSLATGAKVANPISGFTFGDIIQMANVDAVSFNAANGNLTLSDKGLQVDILHLAGSSPLGSPDSCGRCVRVVMDKRHVPAGHFVQPQQFWQRSRQPGIAFHADAFLERRLPGSRPNENRNNVRD